MALKGFSSRSHRSPVPIAVPKAAAAVAEAHKWAIDDFNLETAIALLSHGADIDATDQEGLSPIHLAAINGSVEMMKFLLERGADVNRPFVAGVTPLEYAVAGQRTELTAFLCERGANLERTNKSGESILVMNYYALAPIESIMAIASILLEHGADPLSQSGSAPSAWQAAQGSPEMLQLYSEYRREKPDDA